jgi:hypothetical protein
MTGTVRTTVTLEPDVEALIKRSMRERGLSFKAAINEAIRAGLTSGRAGRGFRTRTYAMGRAEGVDLDKALQLAGELEDEEILRKMSLRK